jgi:short-subunit dehydrogenase
MGLSSSKPRSSSSDFVIIIGASTGIGRELTKMICAKSLFNMNLLIGSRSESSLKELTSECEDYLKEGEKRKINYKTVDVISEEVSE